MTRKSSVVFTDSCQTYLSHTKLLKLVSQGQSGHFGRSAEVLQKKPSGCFSVQPVLITATIQ